MRADSVEALRATAAAPSVFDGWGSSLFPGFVVAQSPAAVPELWRCPINAEYYRRFGFQNIRGLVHEGVPEEVFFTLSLDGHIPQGIVEFHVGFKADGQQEGAGDALPART